MRNAITLITTAAIAMAPGCKQNAESPTCIKIEKDIRHAARLFGTLNGFGHMSPEGLCVEAASAAIDMEMELKLYMDECGAPKARMDSIKSQIENIRALQMKVCNEAYPDAKTEGK